MRKKKRRKPMGENRIMVEAKEFFYTPSNDEVNLKEGPSIGKEMFSSLWKKCVGSWMTFLPGRGTMGIPRGGRLGSLVGRQ